MIANSIRVLSGFTQDWRPGAFSVVPAGLIAIRPDNRFVFNQCCPNRVIEKSQFK
jgi:hypothetical protein